MSDEKASAVLLSGGLDSAVLLVEEADVREVQPIYVSVGFAWEAAERQIAERFLAAISTRHPVRPLASLGLDMTDVYPAGHWALAGRPPAYHTADEEVYLPGRNVILVAKAAVYCAAARLPRLSIGTLQGNPFPDATKQYRAAMGHALSLGLDHSFEIDAPYESLDKTDVVRRGLRYGVPLELTLSCMNPVRLDALPIHCGLCSKCRERHDGFVAADVEDPTVYHDQRHVSA
ncbi:MAG: 7-cyano-7-deazaguanine synthase [Vicinamibacterales bacterium]